MSYPSPYDRGHMRKIPVFKMTDVAKPNFKPPTASPSLRWFSRLPESPFGGEFWPVFHDGEWHWVQSPPKVFFQEVEVENS
jgi:hypothetical protein